uniref:KH type-2 domain-containing protein n=3 Tax=Chloropicon roscoffensis TaxID=1461544 RepID=A0A7S3C6X1_9CHLO|mmetsp:Transcript_10889/g.33257  ORF Transcript_10889/g.33257 Transcript_10889/m.33257 type:complete len:267 (-) Transcript_10889:4-804(-)
MIFDTPGVVDHKHYRNMRQRERVSDAYATAALCDALVFVVDAERQLRKPDPRVERLVVEYRREVEGFGSGDAGGQAAAMPKSVLAMNKVDLVRGSRRGDLLDLARRLNDLGSFDQIFMVSSLKGTGTEDLLAYLRSVSVPHRTEEAVGHGGGAGGTGWLSQCEDEESSHDHSSYAVELVKEQVYRRLNGEIPYVLKIKPVSTKFLRDGSLRIEQDLLVNHMKKKKIVVGRKGQAIGQIGCRARAELEKQLGLKVHLILNVKVRKQD